MAVGGLFVAINVIVGVWGLLTWRRRRRVSGLLSQLLALSHTLAFLQGAYEAGARLSGWDTSGFESKWCPTPTQLHELQATAACEFGRPAFAAAAAETGR